MKSAVPGEVVDAGGGFEEEERRAGRDRRLPGDPFRHTGDLPIVKPAGDAALEALFEEFRETIHVR